MSEFAKRAVGVSLLALLCASCAAVKIESWTDPAFKGRPMGKAMVVGVTDSEALQRQYEDLFVSGLTKAGADAVSSSSHFPADTKLTKEQLQAKLGEEGVKSLLVTRVIDEKEKAQYHAPVAYPAPYHSYFGYYSYTFDYVHSPGYVTSYIEIHLETNLYDVETGKLVWSGSKRITDERTDKANMKRVIEATIKDLQKNQLL